MGIRQNLRRLMVRKAGWPPLTFVRLTHPASFLSLVFDDFSMHSREQ